MGPGAIQISAETLACRRGERLLFQDVSFSAAGGGAVEIAGPNGAGKSSLLRILAGLLKPEAGRVTLSRAGRALTRDDDPAGLIHYLGHQDALKTQMTAREALAFAARWFGGAGDVDAALERLGLAVQADLPAGYLSAGQRRRLALARCVMLARPIWLLDEPAASLDEAGRTLVTGIIAAHRSAGGIVVAATHDALSGDATRVVIA